MAFQRLSGPERGETGLPRALRPFHTFSDDPGRAHATGPRPAPARPAHVLAQRSARMIKIHNLRLQTAQGYNPDKKHGVLITDGRQQLAVKAAENVAEELPLDWVRVDLQGVALQGQDEDAPAL